MALKKRGKTWHTHFFVDGVRFRQSLETSDWRKAQSIERDLIQNAKAGKLAAKKDDFARLAFSAAAGRFLADRKPHLSARSIQTEGERVKPINKKLGDIVVYRMTPAQVAADIQPRTGHYPGSAQAGEALAPLRRGNSPATDPPEHRASSDV